MNPGYHSSNNAKWIPRNETHAKVISALCRRFGGGPVGLKTLSISVSEPEDTVEDVYEPFLIQQGLLLRTPKGRVATPAAYDHLAMDRPLTAPEAAGSLFDEPED